MQFRIVDIGGQAPTLGTSGPLTNGEGVDRELPGFTGHLIPGGTYDPDGPNGQLEACTLGFGFAVTQ